MHYPLNALKQRMMMYKLLSSVARLNALAPTGIETILQRKSITH